MKYIKKDERILLQELVELVDFAKEYILKNGDDGIIYRRYRTILAWNMFILMAHEAESVLMLLKKRRIYSTNTLVRVMIEQWINMNYMYLTKDYESFVRFLYHGDVEFIKNVEAYEELVKSPKYIGDFKEVDFQEIIEFRRDSIKQTKSLGHSLKRMPDLRTRARLIDEKNDNIKLSELYVGWYVVASANVHSAKDTLVSMANAAENYEQLFTGYGLINGYEIGRCAVVVLELLSNAMLFVEHKSKLSIPAEGRDMVLAYATFRP